MQRSLWLPLFLGMLWACRNEPPPPESVAAAADFHADSLADRLLDIPQELEQPTDDGTKAVSEETLRRLKIEREKAKEKLLQKIEDSKMKLLSCEEILDRYAQAMEACAVQNDCMALERFDARDIAFKACRNGELKARFDSLERRFR